MSAVPVAEWLRLLLKDSGHTTTAPPSFQPHSLRILFLLHFLLSSMPPPLPSSPERIPPKPDRHLARSGISSLARGRNPRRNSASTAVSLFLRISAVFVQYIFVCEGKGEKTDLLRVYFAYVSSMFGPTSSFSPISPVASIRSFRPVFPMRPCNRGSGFPPKEGGRH